MCFVGTSGWGLFKKRPFQKAFSRSKLPLKYFTKVLLHVAEMQRDRLLTLIMFAEEAPLTQLEIALSQRWCVLLLGKDFLLIRRLAMQ